MSPSEKIFEVRKRLSYHRLVNLSLLLLAPVLGLVLLIAAVHYRLLSPLFYIPGLPLFLALVVWSARRFHLGQVSPTEAARAIDGVVSGKDRFLTLASLPKELSPDQQRSVALLAQQGESFGKVIVPERDFPFQLSREAKYSLWTSPILTIGLLFLLLSPLRAPAGIAGTTLKSQQLAEELRDLSQELVALPGHVKDELETLALVLEESGLQSEDAEDALIDAFEEVQAALAEQKPQSEEVPPQTQEQQNPEQQKQEQQHQEQSEPQQTKDQQEKEQQAEGEQGEKKEADSSKQESDSEERGEKEGEESGSSGKASGEGEKKEDSAPSKGKEAESAGEASGSPDQKQGSDGNEQQNSPADGKGDGKSVGSQSKPSDQDQNAQDKAQSDAQSGAGGKGQKQDTGGGSQERDAGAKENLSGNQLSQAKEKLEEIQKEMEGSSSPQNPPAKDQKSEQPQSEQAQSEQGGKNSQGNQQDANQPQKQDQQSAENQQGQEQKQDPGQGAGKGPGKTPQPQDGQSPDQQPSEEQRQQPGAHRPQDSPQETKSQDKQGKSSTPREGDSRLADQAAAKDSPQGKNDRPTNVDDPQVPPRYTSSGEGKDGLDHSKVKQYTKIEVPQEEKILVRNVGGSDGKTYKNTSPASAKTKLGAEDFEKPKADQTKEKQAIPVEYQGLLR